jgi:hypothetical protein
LLKTPEFSLRILFPNLNASELRWTAKRLRCSTELSAGILLRARQCLPRGSQRANFTDSALISSPAAASFRRNLAGFACTAAYSSSSIGSGEFPGGSSRRICHTACRRATHDALVVVRARRGKVRTGP